MILDCTLRDGGYYTNWDFSEEIVDNYIKKTNKLPIDYLEIGYRSYPKNDEYLGEYFYCPDYVLDKFQESNKKIAIMLNEKDINYLNIDDLLTPCINKVNLIRLAVNPERFKSAYKLAKEIKKFNPKFEIAFNIMYMSDWDSKFDGLIEEIYKLKSKYVDYVYMVDSFGSITNKSLDKIIKLIKPNLDIQGIKLGFHGHNNIELAFSNTLFAREKDVDIVDSTILGMGRGAGNLKTELLLTYLNKSKVTFDFNYDDLSSLVESFTPLHEKYRWGTNLPYIVSGTFSLPQKKVMAWVTERIYSINTIVRGLLTKNETEVYEKFEYDFSNSYDSIIIGGGDSVIEYIKPIKLFLRNNPSIQIVLASTKHALLFEDLDNPKYYCLVGNEGVRLEKVFNNRNPKGTFIIPSKREMGTYVPDGADKIYQLPVDDTIDYFDSATYIALEVAQRLFSNSIYAVGYDGYENPDEREMKLFEENNHILTASKVISLTPTKYDVIKQSSIFTKLI